MRDDHFTCWTHHNISFRFRVRALLTRESVFFWKSLPRPTAWPCQLLKALARFTLESLSSHASRACWIKTFRIGQVLERRHATALKRIKRRELGSSQFFPTNWFVSFVNSSTEMVKTRKTLFCLEKVRTLLVFYLKYIYYSRRTIYT